MRIKCIALSGKLWLTAPCISSVSCFTACRRKSALGVELNEEKVGLSPGIRRTNELLGPLEIASPLGENKRRTVH